MALALWVSCLAVPQSWSLPARAQESDPNHVEAALLFNLAKFVEWSDDPARPFVICVVGDDPLENQLNSAAKGKTVKGQPFEIRRIKADEHVPNCKMAFVSSSERRQARSVIASFEGASTVTVSDWPDFTRQGGIIDFSVEGDQVHFEVNVKAAQRSHLIISSKLLSLARIVGD